MTQTRYLERRRHVRVPLQGPMRWRCGQQDGVCELVNISAGGAAFTLPLRQSARIGPTVELEIEMAPGRTWQVAGAARIIRRTRTDGGHCMIGVEFDPQDD